MKVTFKDVGQGDSILLEWIEDGKNKIGIIDCNIKDGKNPVRDYIRDAGYKNIEFLILSHPHTDHYSGMVKLLDYCETAGVGISSFAHTLHLLATDYHKYLNAIEAGTEEKRQFEKFLKKVHTLRSAGIIKYIDFLVEGSVVDITDGIQMRCLSPCGDEARTYMKAVDLEPAKNKTKASASANYLSTVFKVVVGDKYLLLTSDSEVQTFERIRSQNRYRKLTTKNLTVCQLPHHGAESNYHPPFWNYVKLAENPQAVASAGVREKYKHPHLPVLMGFHNQGYTIHSTNIVYGMVEYVKYLEKLASRTDKLDTFSTLISSPTGGDKSFNLL